MAKRNVVHVARVQGDSVKADKLSDRTIKTVKAGDYILSTLTVRGVVCDFAALVTGVEGNVISTVFGSYDTPHKVEIPKGGKLDVYRPL